MKRWALVVASAAIGLAASLISASGDEPTITLDPPAGPCQAVTVTGSGFPAGAPIYIGLALLDGPHPQPVRGWQDGIAADASGAFAAVVDMRTDINGVAEEGQRILCDESHVVTFEARNYLDPVPNRVNARAEYVLNPAPPATGFGTPPAGESRNPLLFLSLALSAALPIALLTARAAARSRRTR